MMVAPNQPRPDPNYPAEKLNAAADKFMAAAQEYWEAARKSGIPGAVVWIESTKEGFALYTRGEYRETILRNIHELGSARVIGGISDE